ncbi:hypothetical protein [Actinoplanes sp. DH11]|uniref:hypothetical protein n=1 Tax=Actinoplanes sp. DH11 TaxID=2857011 RepID=UPI001E468635|nr:hypothetical protein [Actinoplanes sp. DH11]
MRRFGRLVATPFGFTSVVMVLLACWALWSGGVFESRAGRDVRTSSVHVDPGFGTAVDEEAAEQVIGNRRLVVLFLSPGADPAEDGCDRVDRAARGTLVLVLRHDADGGYDRYGCDMLPKADSEKGEESFGRSLAVETTISRGVDQFTDRPVEALKVVVVTYDLMVRSGLVPDGARTISPSFPRFLVAFAALATVVLGALIVWSAGRRAGRLAAERHERLTAAEDDRAALSAAVSVLAQHIIDLDASLRHTGDRQELERLTGEYLQLLDEMTAPVDDVAARRLTRRVQELIGRTDALPGSTGPGRRAGRGGPGRWRRTREKADAVIRKSR